MSTVIENIKTGEKFVIEDNVPFSIKEFKIIDNLDNLKKKEENERIKKEFYLVIAKCKVSNLFCNKNLLFDYF